MDPTKVTELREEKKNTNAEGQNINVKSKIKNARMFCLRTIGNALLLFHTLHISIT